MEHAVVDRTESDRGQVSVGGSRLKEAGGAREQNREREQAGRRVTQRPCAGRGLP